MRIDSITRQGFEEQCHVGWCSINRRGRRGDVNLIRLCHIGAVYPAISKCYIWQVCLVRFYKTVFHAGRRKQRLLHGLCIGAVGNPAQHFTGQADAVCVVPEQLSRWCYSSEIVFQESAEARTHRFASVQGLIQRPDMAVQPDLIKAAGMGKQIPDGDGTVKSLRVGYVCKILCDIRVIRKPARIYESRYSQACKGLCDGAYAEECFLCIYRPACRYVSYAIAAFNYGSAFFYNHYRHTRQMGFYHFFGHDLVDGSFELLEYRLCVWSRLSLW